MTTKTLEDWEKSWDRLYPGRGKEFMELLAPLYKWTPRLAPERSDLQKIGRKAVFWKKLDGVYCVDTDSVDEHRYHYLFGGYGDPRHDALMPPKKVRQCYKRRLRGIEDRMLRALATGPKCPYYYDLKWAFRDLLFIACWLLAQGKRQEAMQYKPLIELWLSGNAPVCLTRDGARLVVRTA